MVKLEIVGSPNDRLIENLDDILAGLQNGGGKYELVQLDDVKYRNDLTELANYWQELKQEIAKSREGHYTNTKLLPMSENYFILADQVVSDAEVYSQKIADRLQLLEFCMIVNVVILLIILAIYHLQSRSMQRKYKKLSATAYVDVQTGLANKSSCEKKLQDQQWLDKHVGFLMFDMNNLKQVAKIKFIANDIDPNAFMIIMSASEVMGKGFSKPKAPAVKEVIHEADKVEYKVV